ncbi:unnamed protein product [Arabidopsis thaliana]|uniref:(thale cress) hypothetical protein n=1 Tax=Arabidopsis thaliana TaxID=3702 RepID=A0A7G2E881_ARATH|nr:unnamed protein product [Arabidopsis thaliana]
MARVKDSSGEYESTRVEATGEIPPSVEKTAAEIPQRDEEGAELLTTEEEAGEIQPTTGYCDVADLGNSNAVAWDSIDDLSDPNADSCAEEEEATNAVVQHDDGANKDISSILEPDMDERKMLSRVVEKHVDDGIGYIDPIVDSWRERLIVEKKKIFWRSLYQADIDGRRIETVDDVPAVPEPEIPGTSILSFKEAMERGFDKLTDKLVVMDSEIKRICVRVQGIEEYLADQLEKEAEKARYEDMRPGSAADFVPPSYQPRDTQSKALVIHSGIRDPAPPTIESLSDGSDESDEEDKKKKKKKQISKKKRKHVGPTLESGEKRGRKPSKYKGEEFTAEGKQTRKRQKN